ncbi:MAG TPA: hypothetical protein VLL25_17405 [Acidimicrobiales bacterium]|nr:hypothetical protein [Acidimicrobiales bacterium]
MASQRPLAVAQFTARFERHCDTCNRRVNAGHIVTRLDNGQSICSRCTRQLRKAK